MLKINQFKILYLILSISFLLLLNVTDISANESWSLKGTLINGSDNITLSNHIVILHVSINEQIVEYSTESNKDGIFYFNDLNHPSDSMIGISSIFQGVLYGKDLGLISNQIDDILLTVYKASDNSNNISISSSTIMLTSVNRSQNTIWVLELSKINNNSNVTFKPNPDKPMSIIRYGLPQNYIDLMIDSDMIGVEFVAIDKGFGILGNIYPGEHQLLFTYGIKYENSDYTFKRNNQFELENFRIISENTLDLYLNEFDYQSTTTEVNDKSYELIEINNIPKGKLIEIDFKNLPKPSLFDQLSNYFKSLDIGWILSIVFLVFSTLIISKILITKRNTNYL